MRILSPKDDQRIYYFAFGANLSPDVLKERQMAIYETIDYTLQDADLRFTLSGFYKDHGFASADVAVGEKVYGKLYLMTKRDVKRMDYFEGVPFRKVHDKIFSEYQGAPFFYYRAATVRQNLKPTQEYLDFITKAYREMDCVPKAYVETLEKTEVLDVFEPLDRTGKFVKHQERWPKLVHPLLIRYEGLCQKLVFWLWNRSLFNRWLG
jgi:hypothetical protein